jgi:hypothetical protein
MASLLLCPPPHPHTDTREWRTPLSREAGPFLTHMGSGLWACKTYLGQLNPPPASAHKRRPRALPASQPRGRFKKLADTKKPLPSDPIGFFKKKLAEINKIQ